MATDQKKERKGGSDLSGSRFTVSLWCVGVVVTTAVMVWSGEMGVGANPIILTTNVSMVVAKSLIVGPCVNNGGSIVGDGDAWFLKCSRIVCHVDPAGFENYTVTHGCRDLVPSENPDATNCNTVENSGAAYPACCPYLQCGSAPALPTASPNACEDLSGQTACGIWKLLTNNCTTHVPNVYNYSQVYCRASCGLCSPSVG